MRFRITPTVLHKNPENLVLEEEPACRLVLPCSHAKRSKDKKGLAGDTKNRQKTVQPMGN
jgi:hypothetical protein